MIDVADFPRTVAVGRSLLVYVPEKLCESIGGAMALPPQRSLMKIRVLAYRLTESFEAWRNQTFLVARVLQQRPHRIDGLLLDCLIFSIDECLHLMPCS